MLSQEEEAANAAALAARVGELERELAASRRVNRQAETDKKVRVSVVCAALAISVCFLSGMSFDGYRALCSTA